MSSWLHGLADLLEARQDLPKNQPLPGTPSARVISNALVVVMER
jgi:hypothetical protein